MSMKGARDMAESRNGVRIDPEQIPQRVKDDFGYRLFLGYREAMKDPENAKKFRELGLAFEARRARQRAEEERAAAEKDAAPQERTGAGAACGEEGSR